MRMPVLPAALPLHRARPIILLLAVLAALLVVVAPAHANPHAVLMAGDPQSSCQVNGDNPEPFLQAHDATILRIVVPDFSAPGALGCVQLAEAEGYRVYLSFQYNNAWSPTRVASYFAQTLPQYAPYVWAVSVGNEQDIFSKQRLEQGVPQTAKQCTGSGKKRHCATNAGAFYREVWNAVEPVIAKLAPKAERVYGDVSPWGLTYLKDSFAAGKPRGVTSVAFHCYDTHAGGLRIVPRVSAWAASYHLPLWCSEMSDALKPLVWGRRDTAWQWQTLLAGVERRSPDLKMISYYEWPLIGAI